MNNFLIIAGSILLFLTPIMFMESLILIVEDDEREEHLLKEAIPKIKQYEAEKNQYKIDSLRRELDKNTSDVYMPGLITFGSSIAGGIGGIVLLVVGLKRNKKKRVTA